MTILDIAFITIFIIYLLRGLISGLVSSSISILSKAAALFLAVGVTPYLQFTSPFIIFWATLLGFLVLTGLFRIFFLKKNNDKISLFDRLLGSIIGGLDAIFIGGLITYFILGYPYADWSTVIEKSQIGDFFASYIYQARSVIHI